jgi:hypothetical protein
MFPAVLQHYFVILFLNGILQKWPIKRKPRAKRLPAAPEPHFANVWQKPIELANVWQKLKPARRALLPMFGKNGPILPMFGKSPRRAFELQREGPACRVRRENTSRKGRYVRKVPNIENH